MQLDFAQANDPFLSATITVVAGGVSREDQSDAVRVRQASVKAGDPATRTVGDGNGEQWAVAFREADWISTRKPTRGMMIEADVVSNRWPRLTVQRVQTLGGMILLECSAREKGVRP